MKTKPRQLLLHPAFLLSLVSLLLNDFYFKYEFHNTFTGKLSDFAGLFSFAVFLSVIFPGYKKAVVVLIALLFILWKSPLSDPLIYFFNHTLHLPVHRVVDYTDYVALLILPLSFYLKPVHYTPGFLRQLATTCIGIISLTAFTATSMIRRAADDNRVELEKYVKTKKSEAEIIAAMKKDGMDPQPLTAVYDRMWSRDYYGRRVNPDSSFSMVRLDSAYSGIYQKVNYGKAYTIPLVMAGNDSIKNLELIISDINSKKNRVRLRSFEHRWDSTSGNSSYYYEWRRFRKPLKKKFKSILRK